MTAKSDAFSNASESPPSRSPGSRILNVVVSVLVLAVCLFGYTLLGERKRPDRTKPPKSPLAIVSTEPMQRHAGPVPIAVNGVIVPLREIRLATEVSARIIEQSDNLRAGRSVDADEVLIRLDDTEYKLEVRRLQAQAAQEKSELAAADVSIDNAEQLAELAKEQVQLAGAEAGRLGSLISRQAASASEVDLARRAELTARASLVELENRRRDLAAQRQLIIDKQSLTAVQLERAELDLARCVVRSPIDGVVVQSSVEEQSFIATGTVFVTIEDSAAVEVRVNLTSNQMVWVWQSGEESPEAELPEAELPEVELPEVGLVQTELVETALGVAETAVARSRVGQVPQVPAEITRSFGNDVYTWAARLERIDGAGIDAATRTYPCLFRVDHPATTLPDGGTRRLTRGMFVDLTILADPNRPLHRISEIAIRPGNRVWLNVGGKLRIAQATVVTRIGESLIVELPADFASGSTDVSVITSPLSDPVNGMPVGTAGQAAGKVTFDIHRDRGGCRQIDRDAGNLCPDSEDAGRLIRRLLSESIAHLVSRSEPSSRLRDGSELA